MSAYVLDVHVAEMPGFKNKMESQKRGSIVYVPEAFEAPSGQNEDISLDTNSTFGKACHKHKDGGYEPGRAEEIFQEEFGPAIDQEGGEYKYGRSVEFGEACHQ